MKWRCHKFCEVYCKDCIEEEFEDEGVDAVTLLELDWSLSLLSYFRFLETLWVLITFICNEDNVYI